MATATTTSIDTRKHRNKGPAPRILRKVDIKARIGGQTLRFRTRYRYVLIAILLSAIAGWATVPYGSVAPWTHALLILLIAATTILAALILPPRDGPIPLSLPNRSPRPGLPHQLSERLAVACLLGLLAWITLQCLPIPPSLHRTLHHALWSAFPEILTGAPHHTIAMDPGRTILTTLLWLAYGALIWLAARVVESRKASLILTGAIVLVALGQAVYGILTLGAPAAGDAFAAIRLRGTFSGANALGGLLAIGIPTCLGLLMSAAARMRPPPIGRRASQWLHTLTSTAHGMAVLILIPCLSVLIVALLLTASRGALFSTMLASTCLCTAFARQHRRRGEGIGLAAFVLLVGIAVAVVGAGGVYALLARRLDTLESGADTSFRARLAIIRGILDLLRLHPCGVGPGCFATAFSRFQAAGYMATRVYKAHNDYLHTLAELGIPGVLLAIPLVIKGGQAIGKALRPRSSQPAVWLWAGLGAAVTAALLHALVDFNLSSRPGVAVACCLALGLLIGRNGATAKRAAPHLLATDVPTPRSQRAAAHAAPCAPSRAARFRLPILLPAITLAAGAGLWLHAEITCQQAYHALGGEPDIYFWLAPTPAAPRAKARAIDNAIRILPFDADYRHKQGRAQLLLTERAVADQFQAALAANAGGASTNQIRAMVEIAARQERRHAALVASEAFACAMAMSPWEPTYRIEYAHALAYACVPTIAEDIVFANAALREARNAARLAPNTGYILMLTAAASATLLQRAAFPAATRTDVRNLVRQWGAKAMHLDPSTRDSAFGSMLRAGVDPSDLIESATLPPGSLWILYKQLRESRHRLASPTLAALGALLDRPDNPTIAPSFAHERQLENLDRLRDVVALERVRVALATGDTVAYRAALAVRVALWRKSVAQVLGPERAAWADVQRRAPRLRKIDATRGLTPEWQRWLAIIDANQTGNQTAAMRLLYESIRSRLLYGLAVPPDVAALQLKASEALHHNQFTSLLRALTGTTNEAAAGLANLRDQAPPAHWQALPTAVARAQTLPGGTLDSLTLARITAPELPLHELAAPLRLDAAYLGGRLILQGLDIHPRAINGSVRGCRVSTVWQVNGSVPPDAVLILRALDASGQNVSVTSIAFATAASSVVRLQDYQVGQTIRLTGVLSARALGAASIRLQVWQRQARQTLPTLEGLRTIEIGALQTHMRPLMLMGRQDAAASSPSIASPFPENAETIREQLATAWGGTWPMAITGSVAPVPLPIVIDKRGVDSSAGIDCTELPPDSYILCARQDAIHVLATSESAAAEAIRQLAMLLTTPTDAKAARRSRAALRPTLCDPIWYIGSVTDREHTDAVRLRDEIPEVAPP
jgi:hypothetical protein